MGIFDFVKGGVAELAIARPDAAKGLIVYKHPDTTIPMKAQLTVEPDEVALFVKDGKFIGQLPPGRHTLETGNIPFLGQLVDKFTGGNLWIAEVFFVTTREIVSLKFGGKIGKIRDPQSGLAVELMVHGSYSMKVFDPPKLVIGLVGLGQADNESFVGWFREQVLKTIRDDVAELMVKKKWPMLDVTSGAYTEEICTEVISGARTHVESYGVEVTAMGNFHLSMKEDDEERLNKLYENSAYINMAGGIDNYQKVAAASAMMNAGEGMKSGGGGGSDGMAMGAGLGMGMAMANQMGQSMSGGGSSHNAPADQSKGQSQGQDPAGQVGGMPDVMTPAQAAQVVQVSEADIVASIESGDLKARKIGASYRITRASLEAFLHG